MTSHPLRSRNWFGRQDLDGFVHRSWLKSEGFSDHVRRPPRDRHRQLVVRAHELQRAPAPGGRRRQECIRAYPLDAVVLLSGCDKTTPAMLMGSVWLAPKLAQASRGDAAWPLPSVKQLQQKE